MSTDNQAAVREASEKGTARTRAGITGVAAPLLLIAAAYYLLNPAGFLAAQDYPDLSYLLLPLGVLLGGLAVRALFRLFFTGRVSGALLDALLIFTAGLLFFFIIRAGILPVTEADPSPGVLALLFLLALFRAAGALTEERVVCGALLKTAILLAAAWTAAVTIPLFPWGERLELGEPPGEVLALSPDGLLFWSLAGLALLTFCSLLSLSGNRLLCLAGLWAGSAPVYRFGLVLVVVFYFLDLRPFLAARFGPEYLAYEWILTSLLFLVLIYLVTRGIRSLVEKATYAGWVKHRRVVEMEKGDLLSSLAGYVEEFLEKGNKKRLLPFVIAEGLRRGMPPEQVTAITGGLIDYTDLPERALVTHRERAALRARNRNRRETVVAELVRNFEQTGGKKHDSRNGTEAVPANH